MTKYTFYSFLLLVLISCGKNGGGSSSNRVGYNDSSTLPIDGEEYTPRNLSDKVFTKNNVTYAPMNLITQTLTLTFDPVAQTAKGHSVITFNVRNSGRPYFDLQETVKNLQLDGQDVTASSVTDPDGLNLTYRAVGETIEPGATHKIEFDYELASSKVTYTGGGVRFLTDMTDLSGKFFEYWGPTGFEEDAFKLTLNLKILNSSSDHVVYSNGSVSGSGSDWKIVFPEFFTKSSFYAHLTNQNLPSHKMTYQGLEKEIPIEIYGLTQTLVDGAKTDLPKLFKELETDYGPYPHAKFVVYMNDRSGGMEYVGATITARGSLDHELLHSWFARSVIPADGRSGWIDEAMASWRDYGYTRATTILQRSPTNLADYSAYRKSTPSNCYVDGRNLFAELDSELASSGGLKPAMKAFYKKYKNKVVTNEEFWHFLEEHTGKNLSAFNERYAMGGSMSEVIPEETPVVPLEVSKHPNPLTEEEILRLR